MRVMIRQQLAYKVNWMDGGEQQIAQEVRNKRATRCATRGQRGAQREGNEVRNERATRCAKGGQRGNNIFLDCSYLRMEDPGRILPDEGSLSPVSHNIETGSERPFIGTEMYCLRCCRRASGNSHIT
jgi:hypothetical protein